MTMKSILKKRIRHPESGNGFLTFTLLTVLLIGLTTSPGLTAGNGVSDCLIPEGLLGSPEGSYTADQFEVGDTRFFWAYAQGFFQGYYPVSATCQQISDYAYLFTEDAYVNDIVSYPGSDILYLGTNSGAFKSIDGGNSWFSISGGLPDVDGVYDDFDSTNYNRRAVVHCIYSRGEMGGTFDTLWVGTEFGPFWTTAGGDTMELRAQLMNTDPDEGNKPATYDILGHPTEEEYLWSATQDGLYMTRNANRWKHISNGLPPSEEAAWVAAPQYNVDYTNDLLFTVGSKGIAYGDYRALGSSASANIIVSWKPLGGLVTVAADTANADTLWLTVDPTTSLGLTIAAGQTIALVDTVNHVYWNGFIDESAEGLWCEMDNDRIYCWPEGNSAPEYDYTDSNQVNLGNVVAYGYSQISARAMAVQSDEEETTIWIGAEDGGLYEYQLMENIAAFYHPENLTVTSSHEDYMIYQIKIVGEDFYFATEQGLFKATDPQGEWEQISGDIADRSGTEMQTITAYAVNFGADNTIYLGSHLGGFMRSTDGETFDHSNLGLIHLNGTSEQLDIFREQFDNVTPADPETGIYNLMQQWWGSLDGFDDIDGDPKIGILFLNIDDQYYLSTGDGSYISGYFDGGNEYLRSYSANSNEMEMFYIDTDPGWINTAEPAACRQMFNLINWNQDPAEDEWLRAGLMAFSQHIAGYPMSDGTISFPTLNNLILWKDKAEDVEYTYSFLVVLYLYEQIFDAEENGPGIDNIADVATSPYHGIPGLGRLIYEKENGTSDPEIDYTWVFADVFHEFALAGALDITDPGFYDGKYGFSAVDLSFGAGERKWYFGTDIPPFNFQLPFWSVQAVQVNDTLYFNADHPIERIVFNGDDRNQINASVMFSFTGVFVGGMDPVNLELLDIDLDPATKKGVLELPEDLQMDGTNALPNIMRLVTTCTSDSGDQRSMYVFSDDITPPTAIWMTVAQNPIDDKYIDIYTFSDERIFPDGGQVYRVDIDGNTELEGPKIDLSGAKEEESGLDTVIVLDQDLFYANENASTWSYHIAYHLEDIQLPADLEFLAYGEDMSGNVQSSEPLAVTVDMIDHQQGGEIEHYQTDAVLLIPGGALADDALIMLSVSQYPDALPAMNTVPTIACNNDPQHFAVGPVVSAGSEGIELTKPVVIKVPFDPEMLTGEEIGVYRSDEDGWICIGGEVDAERGLVTAQSDKFGIFRVYAGPKNDISAATPHRFQLAQNYPNPFNPSTLIEFELTKTQRVQLDVFNVSGQRVETIKHGQFNAGWNTVHWEPYQLSSGIYFLRLKAEEGTLYQKMMLLK